MGRRDIIASLDIGTSFTRVIIGELNSHGTLSVLGLGKTPTRGMHKGDIIDIDDVAQSILQAKEYAERMSGVEVLGFYVGLPVKHVDVLYNNGVVAVGGDDKIITEEDIERALQAARVVSVPPDKKIIDIIPKQYILDSNAGIHKPLGMAGVRLEVEAMLITVRKSVEQNIIRCVERAGSEIYRFVLNPLADAGIVLSEDEKEVGVVLLDVGGGTTEISYFTQGTLDKVASIPLGGYHITNDLAAVLKIPVSKAEEIKLQYGQVAVTSEEDTIQIEIENYGYNQTIDVEWLKIHDIIFSRVEEIYQFVMDKLLEMGFAGPPVAGFKVIGATGEMPGFIEFGESYLYTSIRYAQIDNYGIDDPSFITALGIAEYAIRQTNSIHFTETVMSSEGVFKKVWHWFKDLFE